jgi:uncharacterized protein YdeI (YjbR/CyaY-like superfamily)
VEEALCFGWIDGIIQKIDAERFARRFTPRRARSGWSVANIDRMKKLQKLGALSTAAIVPDSATNIVPPRQLDLPVPDELKKAFKREKNARKFFEQLAPSYRKQYVRWILSAKRDETRLRRVEKAIGFLSSGKKYPF